MVISFEKSQKNLMRFYIFFFFLYGICSNFFVTVIDDFNSFDDLKNNIGYVHQYFPESFSIILLNQDIEQFSEIKAKIGFWKRVHILLKKDIFLNFNVEFSSNSVKPALGIIKYVFENFVFDSCSKVFFFNTRFNLHDSHHYVSKMLMYKNISVSNNHIFLSLHGFKKVMDDVIQKIHMNLFEENYANFFKIHFDDLKLKLFSKDNFMGCKIRFKELHFAPMFGKNKVYNHKIHNRTNIAILIPTLNSNEDMKKNPFFMHTLNSLSKTIKSIEISNLNLNFYIAYDENDIYFKNRNTTEHEYAIKKSFLNSHVTVHYSKFPLSNSVVFLWNSLFVEAYKDNNFMFVQLNDDTEISKSGWITKALNYFKNGFNGVVGFNTIYYGCKLFTEAIVSREHYSRTKGNLYPLIFHNSMSDIWLTEYYKRNRLCLTDFTAINKFSKTRYQQCPYNKRLLRQTLKFFLV